MPAEHVKLTSPNLSEQTMWMIRPFVEPRQIKIDLPPIIIEGLGSGAEILAGHLTMLAEAGLDDPAHHAPPPPVLCRICERQIPPWWFEKHTELCLQEHQAEMEVQICQDNLSDHRHAIVKVLDALEARKSRPVSTISINGMPPTASQAEYKGLPIGPESETSSASGSASPAGSRSARAPSAHKGNHNRTRSFAVRRPQARIVELLLDLCDTAIEISTPTIKEVSSQQPGEFRTQSPGSEDRLSQVMQWETPGSNTLDQEAGLALLCADTEQAARNKVEAVIRHRRILEYSERIRMEFSMIVQDCIDEALRKAERIAAGIDTDSSYEEMEEEQEQPQMDEGYLFPPPAENTYTGTSNLAAALQKEKVKQESERNSNSSRAFSETQGSDSPRECPTPKSHAETLSMHAETLSQLTEARRSSRASTRTSRRGSLYFESGNEDSDCGSFRSSSIMSRMPRVDSPVSEFGGNLRRQASSRQRDRRSMVLPGPGQASPQRQESPSRVGSSGLGSNLNVNLTSSPLRITKPRNSANDIMKSPITSPLLSYTEFTSPSIVPHHHRRQSSANNSGYGSGPPPSPRLNSVSVPQARAVPPSIKDFEIIKPISKGAFGSVYLSKKKSTGDYFAIKVLKKADMVAKNQVTNVKAERAIMMWQGESDFVAKLYWTFSSKDYLYLVMEYLNGGDCASLIKVLGGLPEDWSKKYLGEVILGVEHLHSRGIVHRDLKPDNLLIDQKGHLKLTDFGLSRMGLIGRQKRVLKEAEANESAPDLLKNGPFARSSSIGSSRSTSFDFHNHHSPGSTPVMTPDLAGGMGQPSYFSLTRENSVATSVSSNREASRRSMRSESGNSDAISHMLSNFTLNDQSHSRQIGDIDMIAENGRGSPEMYALQQITSHASTDLRSTPPNAMMPPAMALFDPDDTTRRFVGTPDYLAPETVKGLGQDETSDWWSVGCILFEFLYGYPPFHGETPEKVFENILARKISWPDDDEVEVSAEAKDLMNKMLCMDPKQRLGANTGEKYPSGGAEIKAHPWFNGVNWDTLLEDEAQFVPAPENLEDTEYFDSRGATLQTFAEEMEDQLSPAVTTTPAEYAERPHDALSRVRTQVNNSGMKRGLMPLHIPPHVRDLKSRRLSEPVVADDFGNFAFKNLPVLEKANKDVIQKLRADALAAQSKSACVSPISGPSGSVVSPQPTLEGSPAISMPVQRTISNAKSIGRPSSPAGFSAANSSPSRQSQPSSPLLLSFVAGQDPNRRKTSSNSSSLSQHQTLAPGGGFFDVPRISPGGLQKSNSVTAASSPLKARGVVPASLAISPQKSMNQMSSFTPKTTTPGRTRSQTVGSQDGSNHGSPLVADSFSHHKRRSGVFDKAVFDMSPSSSDNENDKASALLRVQRRRQSSRRLSHINLMDGPIFRPLDVLICEPAKVYQLMMIKLLERLRCRTIVVSDGAEATRVAMGEIKFDIIMMEFKLPNVNGTDAARMIRSTKNVNSNTPIVAVTSYLKELPHPHFFDDLIEKPPTTSSLTDVMCRFCNWKAPTPGGNGTGVSMLQYPMPSGLRQESKNLDDSPSTSGSSNYHLLHGPGSSFRGSSRGGSIGSSLFGDNESVMTDDIPTIISRKATGDWGADGLGITVDELLSDTKNASASFQPAVPHLLHQSSAPPNMQHGRAASPHRIRRKEAISGLRDSRLESAESGDDEDEELGDVAVKERSPKTAHKSSTGRGSKLGTEMMRTNSRGSVVEGGDLCDDGEKPQFDLPHLNPSITRSTESISPDDLTGRISLPNFEDASPKTVEKSQLTPPNESSEEGLSAEGAEEDEFKTPIAKMKGLSLGSEEGSAKGGSKSGTDSEEPTPRPTRVGEKMDYLSAGEPSLR